MQHFLPATPSTVHWGYFNPRLADRPASSSRQNLPAATWRIPA
jgi:hypothetical protein